MATALEARIRPYQGEGSPRCDICFTDEHAEYVQTACCANTLGTEVIIKTYHRDCLKHWADQPRFADSELFNCPLCLRTLHKQYFYPNLQMTFGETFVQLVREGNANDIEMLLDDPQMLDLPIGGKNSLAHALYLAVENGNEGIVRIILNHPRVVDIPRYQDYMQIINAPLKDREGILQLLGYRRVIQDQFHINSSLFLASEDPNKFRIFMALVNSDRVGENELIGRMNRALRVGNANVARWLLGHPKYRIIIKGQHGLGESLTFAALGGDAAIVRDILNYPRANEIPANGSTESSLGMALSLSAREGHLDVVRTILANERSNEISVTERFSSFQSALEFASSGGHSEIIMELLAHQRIQELPSSCILTGIAKAKNNRIRLELVKFLKNRVSSTVKIHSVLATPVAVAAIGIFGGWFYHRSRTI